MKSKFFKTLKILTSFVFIFGIFCNTMCKARWELIELPTGNILKISGVKLGKLHDELQAVPSGAKHEHIVVIGEMNPLDFLSLGLKASIRKYKSIDLSRPCLKNKKECLF